MKASDLKKGTSYRINGRQMIFLGQSDSTLIFRCEDYAGLNGTYDTGIVHIKSRELKKYSSK